jgi:NADH-quinone oxidoreductase subunit K
MITLHHYLLLAALLFVIGLYGALTRRNAIGILMAIELMLNAVNINFVAFSRFVPQAGLSGQVFVVFVITVAACEAAVGLALILCIFRTRRTVEADEVNLLKW